MNNTGIALFLLLPSLFFAVQKLAIAATITFTNNCSYTVWPGTMAAGDHMPLLSTTGFELPIGASKSVNLPSPWSGRIWGRTGCSNDSGIFVCVTGDCGSDQVECNGAGASLPTTLVELKTASKRGQDLYYVSNVNGFNLPMSIAPKGGLGVCNSSSCPADVTSECPEELQVRWSDGRVIACKSACLALNTTDKCQPTTNSQIFEELCPDAYGYSYDNVRLNGSFTCSGGPSYTITFCPYYHRKTGTEGGKITFTNKCPYTVWPGTITGDQNPQLSLTGFELATGASNSVDVPSPWSGRFWGRTGCSSNSGKFTCTTADCGTGQVACNGNGGDPPATLAELTVASNGGQDFYDISNVDGFNVPMSFTPQGGTGDCKQSSCPVDINAACPAELQVKDSDGKVIACKNACLSQNKPQYCCTGDHNTNGTCIPTIYSQFYSIQCPKAYSYPYDDKKGTFTCFGNPDYVITFCP